MYGQTSLIISETRDLKQFTPIHVAIEFGNLDLIDHVLERIRKKIPSGSVMIIPPGNNMSATFRFLISKHSMNKISVRA